MWQQDHHRQTEGHHRSCKYTGANLRSSNRIGELSETPLAERVQPTSDVTVQSGSLKKALGSLSGAGELSVRGRGVPR